MHRWIVFVFLTAVLSLAACTSNPSGPRLSVEDAWVRPPATEGGNGAIYFRLVNNGNEADTLLSVDSPLATAEVHQTVTKENGVMGMEPAGSVEIPAKGEVEFKQGGMHVMLIGLEQPLAAGDTVPLTLRFDHAGELKVEVSVREQ
ncbi:MAG: copper chaperone PCu(A)C [Anaerolineae bacterium]